MHPNCPSGIAMIQVTDSGENNICLSPEANAKLTAEAIESALEKVRQADYLLMQLKPQSAVSREQRKLQRKRKLKIILNPAPARELSDELLSKIDIITPNETEAELLTGVKVDGAESAQEAAKTLHEKGVDVVIITLGAKGVFLSEKRTGRGSFGFCVEAKDTTAAGDTFNGAFVTGLLEQMPVRSAISFAHAAAAISVTRLGAQTSIPNRHEVEVFKKVSIEGGNMATMKDIAKLAGVSTSTVSHVINQTRFVSEEISLRVNNATKALNYYAPSALARSLKVNRTNTIGMLVTTSTNPFFGEVVKGVERNCYQQGYNLILCNTEGDNARMRDSINTLMQKRVDGFILMCSSLEGERIDVFERYPDVPVVVMDWGPMLFTKDKIQDNSLLGSYLATQHLIDNGHTNIGCITGPLIKYQAQMRYEGYKRAMLEKGLEFNADWIVESDFECEGGYHAFKTMSDRGRLPSAIFVSNDMMAMGVINAARANWVFRYRKIFPS